MISDDEYQICEVWGWLKHKNLDHRLWECEEPEICFFMLSSRVKVISVHKAANYQNVKTVALWQKKR